MNKQWLQIAVLWGLALVFGTLALINFQGEDRYTAFAAHLREPLNPSGGSRDLIRYATLAASGHNTQPWQFRESAQAIAEVCMLAGCPDRAAQFIAAGKTEAEVRRALIDARAAQTEATAIRSTITVDAGTATPSHTETSPIVAAVKKLTGTA